MNTDTFDALPLAKAKTYATAEVWDCHRETIVRLYQTEKKTLKQVNEIMERDYFFLATERMFRTRIKNWGLDKKFKEAEVLEMVQLKRQRDAVGKRSRFTIRGHDVEWDRVVEYLRRRPDLEKRVRSSDVGRSKVLDLTCRTPSPGPRLLQPASETRILEDILRLLRDHINGCVEGRMWTLSQSGGSLYGTAKGKGFKKVKSWARELAVANYLLAAQRPKAAFSLLNRGLDSIKSLIRENDPVFFYSTVERLSHLSKDVRRSLIVFIGEMHQVVLGHQHPMSLIWNHIQWIENKTWWKFYEKTIDSSKSCFGVYYGLSNRIVRWLHISHVRFRRSRRDRGRDAPSKLAPDDLQNVVAPIVTNSDRNPLGTLLRFANQQIAVGQKEAAQETLAQASLLTEQRPPQHDRKWWKLQAKYYERRGHLSYRAGDYEEAIGLDIKAYEIASKIYGAGNSKTLEIATSIAHSCKVAGNYEETERWVGILEESITDGF